MGFALLNIEKKGTLSTQLGPKMGMESRSLSRILKSMWSSGFILKKGDKGDKRKTHLFLSKKGLELRKIAAHQVKSFNERVFKKVSREELKAFYKVMDAVDESIEELKNES
jgi:DNA-binding MarR family transcriptional regulator